MKIDSRLRAPFGIVAGLALVAITASPSRAEVVTTTGSVTLIAAPTSDVAGSGDPTSNTMAFIWAERTKLVLSSNVSVDMTKQGTSDSSNSFQPSPGTIVKGTYVDTYMIHSDTVSGSQTYGGSVTFSTAILGIIDLSAGLDATDQSLGSLTTTYPGAGKEPSRGLEGTDSLAWLSNNGLTINFVTSNAEDEIRVITAAAVPEPSSIISCAIGAAGLLGFGWFRRRRARPTEVA